MSTSFTIRQVPCVPYQDQRPGTAGLRKKVQVFQQEHYLESFLQAIFTTVDFKDDAVLVTGGDGRYLNTEAIQIIARMAAARGVRKLITGQHGLLSTPAASLLIRQREASGGLLLTASHNPGGPDGDFGIKFNTANGGQAPESLTEAIYAASKRVREYLIADLPPIDLGRLGTQQLGDFSIEVLNSTCGYADVMESLFDFDRMADWLKDDHSVCFDALHAITGPYADEILCRRLGAAESSVLHASPQPDFGGFHPDPNPVDAAHLIELANSDKSPDLIAASDGDGDRNMICGPGVMVSPGDSVAVMLANAQQLPGYRDAIPGVARSMPTSQALDVVAASQGIPCHITPTGWRYFCNLLDDGRIGLCGEESFGTGSAHAREKDGLWAVLYWLNLLAVLDQPVGEILRNHWQRFGRHYYQRHDYFIADSSQAQQLVEKLRASLPKLAGKAVGDTRVITTDDFHYQDPVDGSESSQQGLCISFEDQSRVVYRLSGTGTAGATLRVYLELFGDTQARHDRDVSRALSPLARRAADLAAIEEHTGLAGPTATI